MKDISYFSIDAIFSSERKLIVKNDRKKKKSYVKMFN